MSENQNFVKEDFCPTCGKQVDSAMDINDDQSPPTPGDYSLCIGCGDINTFDNDLNIIKLDKSKLSRSEKYTLKILLKKFKHLKIIVENNNQKG